MRVGVLRPCVVIPPPDRISAANYDRALMREHESRYLDNVNRGSPGGSFRVVVNDRRGLISGEERSNG
jgi:hypothetical protein